MPYEGTHGRGNKEHHRMSTLGRDFTSVYTNASADCDFIRVNESSAPVVCTESTADVLLVSQVREQLPAEQSSNGIEPTATNGRPTVDACGPELVGTILRGSTRADSNCAGGARTSAHDTCGSVCFDSEHDDSGTCIDGDRYLTSTDGVHLNCGYFDEEHGDCFTTRADGAIHADEVGANMSCACTCTYVGCTYSSTYDACANASGTSGTYAGACGYVCRSGEYDASTSGTSSTYAGIHLGRRRDGCLKPTMKYATDAYGTEPVESPAPLHGP